jgi:molecular chaperone GrpE
MQVENSMNADETPRESAEDDAVASNDSPTGQPGDAGSVAAGESVAVEGEVIATGAEQAEVDEEPTIESLTQQLIAMQAQFAEREDAVLRMKAELENARKRLARDIENAHKYALERFVAELLPVKDSLELGIAACEGEKADIGTLKEGAELTDKMFLTAVEKFGVQLVDPVGESFNPQFHQAVSMQPTEGVAAGKVVAVMQKGYLLNDRLVRPAMVIVSQ